MSGSILKNRCGFKAIGVISIFFMLFFSTLPNSIKDVNATYEFPNYTEQNLLNDNPSVLPSQSSMEIWGGDSQYVVVLSEAWTTYICLKIDVYNVTPTDEDLSPELLSEWTVPINYQAYASRFASGLGCVSMYKIG